MADSTYNVLEWRVRILPDATEVFILIDNPTDFLPIGGWYRKSLAPDVPSMDALDRIFAAQEYLLGESAGWSRAAPGEQCQFLQDEVEALREQLTRTNMRLAEAIMRAEPRTMQ